MFFVAATEKRSPEPLIFPLPQNKRAIIVADTVEDTILEHSVSLLDSVRYCDNVMTTLKFDWYNLKLLISG